jgi:hypothetical protein
MDFHERILRAEKEIAYIFEKLKEDLGLSSGGTVTTDSGGGPSGPPTKPD